MSQTHPTPSLAGAFGPAAPGAYEIVVYRVKNADEAEVERGKIHGLLTELPGFIGWIRLAGLDAPNTFADLVAWRSLAEAKAAAEKIHTDPRCHAFMAMTSDVINFCHYREVGPAAIARQAA